MIEYKVIKDIIPKSFMFKPSCKEGDILYLSDGMLFDKQNVFICDLGSPLQIESTEESILEK